MIHQISSCIAHFCCSREWLPPHHLDLFIYALETKFSTILFLCSVTVISIISHRFYTSMVFCLSILLLRSRLGGYHCSSPLLCQITSLGLVILNIYLIGPHIPYTKNILLLSLTILLDIIIIVVKPKFPPQLHFTQETILVNTQRKNIIILSFLPLQICSFFISGQFLLYSFLAFYNALISLVAQNFLDKGRLTI